MSLRKTRLYSVACCRRIWPLITDERLRQAIAALDGGRNANFSLFDKTIARANVIVLRGKAARPGTVFYQGRQCSEAEWLQADAIHSACMAALSCLEDETDEGYSASKARRNVGEKASDAARSEALSNGQSGDDAKRVEITYQRRLEECVFGDDGSLDPRWLTSTVMDLATVIYEEKVFDRMPILADALMDAGCDNEEVISHCRSEGPHVRGCWVVDLILGKN